MNDIAKIIGTDSFGHPRQARISLSLRNLSRQYRKDILSSFAFKRFWSGAMNAEQYARLLHLHYFLRKTLEDHIKDISPTFYVVNRFDKSLKQYSVDKFVSKSNFKAETLLSDYIALCGTDEMPAALPDKALELAKYIARAREVYSVSLLGILYMLEETVTYAGPHIAQALEHHLKLKGRAQSYLRGTAHQKADLWAFRRALDTIGDFQTSANIVIASTLTYEMYRDLLNRTISPLQAQSKLHH